MSSFGRNKIIYACKVKDISYFTRGKKKKKRKGRERKEKKKRNENKKKKERKKSLLKVSKVRTSNFNYLLDVKVLTQNQMVAA